MKYFVYAGTLMMATEDQMKLAESRVHILFNELRTRIGGNCEMELIAEAFKETVDGLDSSTALLAGVLLGELLDKANR